MRKLGYAMPSAWAYVYRDAVTLPLVSNIPHARASLPAPFDARLQLLQFVFTKTLISNSDHPRGIKVDDMRVFLRSVCCR